MKEVRIGFDDVEFEKLKQKKDEQDLTWREVVRKGLE